MSVCLQTGITWPSGWSMALLNSRGGWEGGSVGGKLTGAQGSPGIQQSGLPFTDAGEVATRVSGTAFWVKALPAVMVGFSRASFDWAVHFPQWMRAARPTADALNVVTDYSWLTNRRAGSRPINPSRFSPMPLQGDSSGALAACGVNGAVRKERWLKSWTNMIRWLRISC